jgi:ribose transport system permease protein
MTVARTHDPATPSLRSGDDVEAVSVDAGKQDQNEWAFSLPTDRRAILPDLLSNHGLLLFGVALAVIFSLTLPRFFSEDTVNAILSITSIVALLALAEMIVIVTGNYDLSVGYGIGLIHIAAMGMLVRMGVPWPMVVVIAIGLGGLIGLTNGLLIEIAKIDSFIATLGVGTMLYAISCWYTNGSQVIGTVPRPFGAINYATIFGVPLPAIIVGLLVLTLWGCLEFLPTGRRLYAIGSNRRAAELTGIPARRLVIGAFLCSGLIVGVDGVIVAARMQVGQSTVGPEFLLPAFVGALLGATTVRPGRVNPLGTIIAVLVLAVGIAGLQQLGTGFYVEPFFQGAALVVAVGLTGFVSRHRKL